MTGRKWRRNAFTLIELLVVIAVIALLASLLLPSLKRGKWYALRAACLSNLHQVYMGAALYLSDFDGALPAVSFRAMPRVVAGCSVATCLVWNAAAVEGTARRDGGLESGDFAIF